MAEFFSSLAHSFSENIPAQIFGFLAMAINVSSFQFNRKKTILMMQIFSGICFMIQYYLIGAITGAATNLIGIFRAVIFYNSDKKWAQNKAWFAAVTVLSIIAGIFTWKNIFSLFPIVSFFCSSVSLWSKDAFRIRCFYLPASVLFWIYNAVSHSYFGILTDTFVICSIISAFVRFDILKKYKTE